MKTLILIAAIGMAQTSPPAIPPDPVAPCRLKIGVGIGCSGELNQATANSVDFYAAYGLNKARILAPETQAYLSRFLCFRVVEQGRPIGLKQRGTVDIATPQGVVKARMMAVRTADGHERIFWMADPYILTRCPPFF